MKRGSIMRVMHGLWISVDDLHSLAVVQQEKTQLPHNVHFTKERYEALADQVVANIVPVVPASSK